jgi:peptidoglycan LD-endopeptidase LytH
MKGWKIYLKRLLQVVFAILLIGYILPAKPISPVGTEGMVKIDPESFWHYPWGDEGAHKGIDIFCKEKSKIVAPISGLVLKMGYGSVSGNYIYILGPHWKLYYLAHLDTIAHRGLFVKKGAVVGYAGNTGNAKGKPIHVHSSIQTILPYIWRYDKKSPEGGLKVFYLNPLTEIDFPQDKIY